MELSIIAYRNNSMRPRILLKKKFKRIQIHAIVLLSFASDMPDIKDEKAFQIKKKLSFFFSF
jgi:hypothetical protein